MAITEITVSVAAIQNSRHSTGSVHTPRKPQVSSPAWPPMPEAEIAPSTRTDIGSATIFSSTK